MTTAAPNFLESLPDYGGDLATFNGDITAIGAQPMPEAEKAPLPSDPDPRITTRVEKRRMVEIQMGDAAADKLAALPVPGEALHVRMDGSFNGFDFVPGILKLLAPATIRTLYIATLSFNRRVAERLLELIDAGQIGRVVFISSAMFEGKEKHLVDWLSQELATRNSRLKVSRNHCKLILADTSDGRSIVMEGSQNLRTCSCFEQATFTDDRELFEWHRRFIEEVA